MWNRMIFFRSWVFNPKFLTQIRLAFEKRFKAKPEIVTFSDLDWINYHREKGAMPDGQGMQVHASENLLQGRVLLQSRKEPPPC